MVHSKHKMSCKQTIRAQTICLFVCHYQQKSPFLSGGCRHRAIKPLNTPDAGFRTGTHTPIQLLALMKPLFFARIRFGSVRLMASLGNKSPPRARVMCFARAAWAIFHHLLPMNVLNYCKIDYPRVTFAMLLLRNAIRRNAL